MIPNAAPLRSADADLATHSPAGVATGFQPGEVVVIQTTISIRRRTPSMRTHS